MKSFILSIPLLLTSFAASAEHTEYVEKPISFGFGLYGNTVSVDDSSFSDDDLSGVAFSFGYAFTDQFAMRASYFLLDHDDFSEIDSTGFDLVAYLGTGLASQGIKGYVGGGLYNDKWEIGGFSRSFDGLQLNGGIGYNWPTVSLDFVLGLREASDYEDFANETFGSNLTATAVSTMILLSARF